jgi:hypothetical protein
LGTTWNGSLKPMPLKHTIRTIDEAIATTLVNVIPARYGCTNRWAKSLRFTASEAGPEKVT